MENEDVVIGIREHWGQKAPFVLFHNDRRQHLYTIGKSGAGKTTLLRNLILQDIEAGHGVGVIDPHGDLATDLLDHIVGQACRPCLAHAGWKRSGRTMCTVIAS